MTNLMITMRNFLLVFWVYNLLYSMSYEISFTCFSGPLVTRVRPKARSKHRNVPAALCCLTQLTPRTEVSFAQLYSLRWPRNYQHFMKPEGLCQFAAARHVYCTEPVEFVPHHRLFNIHSSVIMSSLKVCWPKFWTCFKLFHLRCISCPSLPLWIHHPDPLLKAILK